jgi:hypothetical protein
LLAYKLGYYSTRLPILARQFWVNAEEGDPRPEFLGRFVEEVRYSAKQLSELLPAANGPSLGREVHASVTRAWEGYGAQWLGPGHQRMIEELGSSPANLAPQVVAETYRLTEQAWGRLRKAAERFLQLLPPPLPVLGRTGSAIAAVFDLDPREEGKVRPVVELQGVLCWLGQQEELPNGLDLDFSHERSVRDAHEDRTEHGYVTWAQVKASRLHDQLVRWLTTPPPVARGQHWISATEAELTARGLGVPLSGSQISKLCKKSPPPFTFRKPAKNRCEVEVSSFIDFLLRKRRTARSGQGADDDRGVAQRIAQERRNKEVGRELD